MKKFLLSLAALALCSSAAMAESVTFDFTNNAYGLPNDQNTYVTVPATVTDGVVTLTLNGDENSWRYWSDGLREYNKKNPTLTVTAGEKNITSISWTVKSGVKFALTSGGDDIASWEGSAPSVTLYADVSTGNAAIQTLTVNFGEGGSENPGGGEDNPPVTPGEGEDVTFDFVQSTYGAGPAYTDSSTSYVSDQNVALQNGVYVTFTGDSSSWRFWNDGIRAYKNKNAEFTVSVPGGKVKSVSWTVKQGATFALKGTTDNITSWEGDEESVSFVYTNTDSNLALITLTVGYEGGNGENPEQPENPGGGDEGEGTLTFLTSNMNNFTIDDVELPDGLNYVWSWDNQYGAKASAYVNSTRYITDSYLISPEFTLSTEKTTATFSQALNFLSGANRSEFANIYVREGVEGEWKTVECSAWPVGSDWGFVDNCELDLSAYAGKNIQIGFRYQSTETIAPTWEVKRLVVEGTLSNTETPEQPEQPGEDEENVTENFTTGIGFPDLAANVPTEPTEYTSTETGIDYTIYGCYANTGYLMMNSKTYNEAFISWTLDFPMQTLVMKTTSGCSTNANNYAVIFADDMEIEKVFVGVQNETIEVEIPEAYQAAGTRYTVKTSAEATANEQFASFTYVKATEEGGTTGVESIETTEGEAVYFNLQGVRVNNPERGIFVKVQNGKAAKVVK